MSRKVSNSLVVVSVFALFSAAVAILLVGCSEKVTKVNDETVITATLYAPTSVLNGQSVAVNVEVMDEEGNPVSGVEVSFSVSPSTAGHFTPEVATTDDNGLATSVFTATGLGTATIQASAQGAQPKTAQIEVVSTEETTKPIEIEITPSWLPADGISTSIIKATVTDSTGTLVEDSTLVKFVAGEEFDDIDEDGYYTEGIDNLIHDTNQDGKWNPIGTIPAYAFTQNGVVQVDYMAGFRTGTAYIKVTAILGCGQIQEDCPIVLVPTDSVAFVVLTPDQSSIQVKGTGGMEATHITATCYDDNGNRTDKDFPVEFYILYGPEGGENLNGDTSYPVTVNTNSWGQAVVTLLSGTKSGVVRLQAKVGGVLSAAPIVTICSGPPFDISVGVTPCNIRGWDINCVEADLCACVVDVYGNPVPDSTSVHFYTDEGMVYCCDQTKAGCAYSTFISADPRNDGIATIYAETEGETGTISDHTNLIVSGPPDSVIFRKYPDSLLADGVSKGVVLVEVLDVNDNFVVNQTPVEMKTDFGSVPSGNTSDGCYASLFETELISQVLPQDYHMTSLYEDDGIGAINVLTAKSGFVSSSVNVTFLTANTYSKNCEIDIEASVPHGSTVPVVVIIRDRYGNPLGGHYIVADQAHTSGGTVAGSAYTNEFGEATGFTFTATTDPGIESGVVSFCDQDPRGMVCIAVKIEISDD
ncbi:MAG: Ig-like domain-containing protein [candidate division Zixibacteria bacterium]|nr:Ig-like domain-containing protein [candidate division Zixibacteria bacterium]